MTDEMYYASDCEEALCDLGRFTSADEAAQAYLDKADFLRAGHTFYVGWELIPDKFELTADVFRRLLEGQADEWWHTSQDKVEKIDFERWFAANKEKIDAIVVSLNRAAGLGETGFVKNIRDYVVCGDGKAKRKETKYWIPAKEAK